MAEPILPIPDWLREKTPSEQTAHWRGLLYACDVCERIPRYCRPPDIIQRLRARGEANIALGNYEKGITLLELHLNDLEEHGVEWPSTPTVKAYLAYAYHKTGKPSEVKNDDKSSAGCSD